MFNMFMYSKITTDSSWWIRISTLLYISQLLVSMIETKFECLYFEIYNLKLIHSYFEFLAKYCTEYPEGIEGTLSIVIQCQEQGEFQSICVWVSHY